MTREEYYKALKAKKAQTNDKDLQSIKAYNEYARQLRSLLEWEEADK